MSRRNHMNHRIQANKAVRRLTAKSMRELERSFSNIERVEVLLLQSESK